MAQFRVIRLSVSIELELCLMLPKSSSPSPLPPRNGVQSLLPLSAGTHKPHALLISSASLRPQKATSSLDYKLLLLLSGAPAELSTRSRVSYAMPRVPLLADGRHSALQVSPVPLPQLPVPLNPHSGRLEELHLDSERQFVHLEKRR